MKNLFLLGLFWVCVTVTQAQTKTTNALQSQFKENTTALFFYKNTMKMWNITDNKELEDMVKDIEKMKFLMIYKAEKNFGAAEYKKLKGDYQKEEYESVMTSRYKGKNLDVFIKEKGWTSPAGTVLVVNDSTNIYVLDIIGTIDLNKVGQFFTAMENNTDIGKTIREFGRRGKDKDEDKPNH